MELAPAQRMNSDPLLDGESTSEEREALSPATTRQAVADLETGGETGGNLDANDARASYPPPDPEEDGPNIEDVMYSASSFTAVLWPVSLTMILSSWAVVTIDTGSNGDGSGEAFVYLPYTGGGSNSGGGSSGGGSSGGGASTGTKLGEAVLNALTLIAIITAMTFIMVGCMYFKCFKALVGFLVLVTTVLLGLNTAYMVQTGFLVWNVAADYIAFYLVFWNFAIVGAVAIFYTKGVPIIITHGYLVLVSITIAWLLVALLPEWTSWSYLVALAFYDLCAVLTPCGPLKLLIELAQERQFLPPGLLYEAEVNEDEDGDGSEERVPPPPPPRPHSRLTGEQQMQRLPTEDCSEGETILPRATDDLPTMPSPPGSSREETVNETRGELRANESTLDTAQPEVDDRVPPRAPQPSETSTLARVPSEGMDVRRTEAIPSAHQSSDVEEGAGDPFESRSIKLGLGDFVFYSVLSGRAALNGFPTMIAVFISVLMGLAGTLILLAMFRKALPALPISICLGVTFYFIFSSVTSPFIDDFILRPANV